MFIGGLGVYLRAVPKAVWQWFVEQTTMTITVTDDDAAFVWVKEWFLAQTFLTRIRRLDLDTTMRAERVTLIPAPGRNRQKIEPYCRFFPEASELEAQEFVESYRSAETMAEFQGLLLTSSERERDGWEFAVPATVAC